MNKRRADGRSLVWLRAQIRSSELWLVFIALIVGAAAGAMAIAMGVMAHAVQVALFGIEPEVRLSVAPPIAPARLLAIPVGGLVLGAIAFVWTRRRPTPTAQGICPSRTGQARPTIRPAGIG